MLGRWPPPLPPLANCRRGLRGTPGKTLSFTVFLPCFHCLPLSFSLPDDKQAAGRRLPGKQ